MMRGGDSTQYGARFITGFIGFRLRNRVQHDSGARLYGGDTVLHQRGADNNTGVQIAVGGEVTDRAAIAAAALSFRIGNQLHGAYFRRAAQGAHVHAGAIGVQRGGWTELDLAQTNYLRGLVELPPETSSKVAVEKDRRRMKANQIRRAVKRHSQIAGGRRSGGRNNNG